MSKRCPFCDPRVLSNSFVELDGFYAIYNHAPVVPGHSMIIPLRHVTDMFALTDQEYVTLFKVAKQVTAFLTEFYNTNEFDMSLQQGFNAGQSINHLHLHIIPRKANDLPGEEWFDKLDENKTALLDSGRFLTDEEFIKISAELKEAWNRYVNKLNKE